MTYDKEKVEGAAREWQKEARDKLFDLVLRFFEDGLWYETGKWYIIGYDQEDLVQIGALSVLRALDTWREEKSAFKTHAWNLIKRDLQDLKSVSMTRERRISEQLWDPEILGDLAIDSSEDFKEVLCRYEIERLSLTERERVVLEGLVQGQAKQDIAKKLDLSSMAISWVVKDLKANKKLKELLCHSGK
jgi:RNA polymerase sigma factor (sigma-70 family)